MLSTCDRELYHSFVSTLCNKLPEVFLLSHQAVAVVIDSGRLLCFSEILFYHNSSHEHILFLTFRQANLFILFYCQSYLASPSLLSSSQLKPFLTHSRPYRKAAQTLYHRCCPPHRVRPTPFLTAFSELVRIHQEKRVFHEERIPSLEAQDHWPAGQWIEYCS